MDNSILLHQQIKESILSLKMEVMANLWQSLMETHQLSHSSNEQLLQMLLQAEWEHRQGKRQDRLVRSAHFRYQVTRGDRMECEKKS